MTIEPGGRSVVTAGERRYRQAGQRKENREKAKNRETGRSRRKAEQARAPAARSAKASGARRRTGRASCVIAFVTSTTHRLQIDALEKGIEPELVGQRIAELRAEKEEAEAELKALGASVPSRPDDLAGVLARLPDLSKALRKAPPAAEAPSVRGLLPRGPLRQGRAADRDLRDGQRGSRAGVRECERPPEGGLSRHSKGHSGGGIRTRDLRVMRSIVARLLERVGSSKPSERR